VNVHMNDRRVLDEAMIVEEAEVIAAAAIIDKAVQKKTLLDAELLADAPWLKAMRRPVPRPRQSLTTPKKIMYKVETRVGCFAVR
jgi:hypothetical protein